jgi:hypothetical protein
MTILLSEAMHPHPEVADLQGLWQRTNLTDAHGAVDETTFVRWGQVDRFYIDIRIPENATGESVYNRRGFAGHIDAGGGLCEWHRTIDFQPPTGNRDIARVVLTGDRLQESGDPDVGSHGFYEETFVRLANGTRRKVAFERDDQKALLLMIDTVFLYAHQRSAPLPQHKSTRDYLASGGDVAKIYECEVSLGTIDTGQPELIISQSVNPAREGTPLFDLAANKAQVWRILHGDMDDALRPYFPSGWIR